MVIFLPSISLPSIYAAYIVYNYIGNEAFIHTLHAQDVDYVFVDHPSFPRPGGLYSDEFGVFGDNQVREATA